MARSTENGWDFVEVGKQYQYKESSFIAMITILEDQSDDDWYQFLVRIDKSNYEPPDPSVFKIGHKKTFGGFYSGMLQIYEHPEYFVNYKWERLTNEE